MQSVQSMHVHAYTASCTMQTIENLTYRFYLVWIRNERMTWLNVEKNRSDAVDAAKIGVSRQDDSRVPQGSGIDQGQGQGR